MSQRKLIVVHVLPELLADMLKQNVEVRTAEKNIVCTSGIPSDAKLYGFDTSYQEGCIRLCFEHDSFEPIPLGQTLPSISCQFKTTYLNESATDNPQDISTTKISI